MNRITLWVLLSVLSAVQVVQAGETTMIPIKGERNASPEDEIGERMQFTQARDMSEDDLDNVDDEVMDNEVSEEQAIDEELEDSGLAAEKSFPPTRKSTTGAIATCKARTASQFVHDDTAYLTCDLRDTLADHHPVYIAWHIDGYRDVKRYNRNGANSVIHIESGQRNPDGSIGHIYWRVCRDRPPLLDNCSRWVRWTV